jgi:hypothetical protein
MVDPGPALRKPPQQSWKAFAWVGGGCFVAVLAMAQVLLLLAWGSRTMGRELEKGIEARKEHPILPTWVPVYPGTHARGLVFHGQGEMSLHTEDPPDRVIDFYAERLSTNGFAVERRMEPAQVYRLKGRRSDGSAIAIRSGKSFGRTWIALGFHAMAGLKE